MKTKAFLIIGLMLSATTAWATGLNSFTVAGTVTSVHCLEFLEPPILSCMVSLETPEQDEAQVICSDPMTAGACRWLEEGDTVLILGNEKSKSKQATHVALLLHDIPGNENEAKSRADNDQRQRLQDLKDAAEALEN